MRSRSLSQILKPNMQCSVYHVLPKKRELVTRSWEPRTHQSTWNQLKQQRNDSAIQRNSTADDWLHQQECFAWDHKHVNICAILLSDILHQLYKGVVRNLVGWMTKTIMDMSIPKQLAKKRRHQGQLKLGQTSKLN